MISRRKLAKRLFQAMTRDHEAAVDLMDINHGSYLDVVNQLSDLDYYFWLAGWARKIARDLCAT